MKIGFIGMGNMASALVKGFLKSGRIRENEICAYAPNQEKLKKNADVIGFVSAASLREAVQAELIVMACKPYQIEEVLGEIGNELAGKALLSVAAGWPFERYHAILGDAVRIQFVMPNTPAMVGEGAFLFEKTNTLKGDEREELIGLFRTMGLVEELPSNLMGIGMAVSGCGPAFVDLMIEAYADAAVRYGLPRATAYKLISQTLLGSARLQLETGEHPGVLKDNVCSPAGTTICGVSALEERGFRAACMASIDAVMNKRI